VAREQSGKRIKRRERCSSAMADPSPVCPAVLTRANQAYGRVLALEATIPTSANRPWDSMDLPTKQRTLHDAETLQGALHDMVEKVRWLAGNESFLPATMSNWRALIEQQDAELGRLDATMWGLRKLIEKAAAQ
jgi:hypothetical protein